MNKTIQIAMFVMGLLALVFAAGIFLEQSWALALWPWPTSRLSNIFVSSIFAAIGAPIIWIAYTKETAAICGGAINLCVANSGMGIYSVMTAETAPGRIFGFVCLGFAVACIVQVALTWRIPFIDQRPLPSLVRASFGIFMVVLVLVGGAMVLRLSNMFPWPLKPDQQVLYGWIFLGAACYFAYGVIRPVWGNAKGQLWGFLAYDLVLIGPYLMHFKKCWFIAGFWRGGH
jgi:hypothetical protein